MPDVSVVMAVRNGADHLATTLHSVLTQEDVALELIVVDDASTDETATELARWAREDVRLRVLTNPVHAGLTRSLIWGCAEARGKYIARQDCGDRSLPGRLAVQAELLNTSPTLAFVSCWTRFCDTSGRQLYEARGTGRATQPLDIIDLTQRWGTIDGPTHHGATMFRRANYAAVGGYRTAFYFGQDWDLWYRLAETGHFQMVPAVQYEALVGPNDLSLRNRRRQLEIARCSRAALELRRRGLSDAVAVSAAARVPRRAAAWERLLTRGAGHYFIGECLRRNGERGAAREYFLQSVRLNPIHPKYWLRLAQTALP